MTASSFRMSADDQQILVRQWMPNGSPRAAMIIAHGAAEHSARYERLATALADAGYATYAPDHRGHGETATTHGWAGEDGWTHMVNDLHTLAKHVQREHPSAPLFLMGHSMGSILAQHVIQQQGEIYRGVVLSGSFGTLDGLEHLLPMVDTLAQGEGAQQPSELFGQMFAGFNTPFQPARTGFEWLSRDEAEVQKYVDDPACGFPFSNQLVADFIHGMDDAWKPENERRIPQDLPVLFISGALDPVGGNMASVNALAERYRANGLRDVTVTFYPEARHELLNETNRDEVQRDLIAWLDARAN